ncbi:MAG TPA: efflux RND transporter permease subunit [Bacteroides graminisolvens]|nr:efflux RND transporter permease subunit [Bacteroides graminisolvens]
MLNKIIHYALHNRLVVLAASFILLIAGLYTAVHTEVDVFPDLNAPTVVIMTEASGMAAEEVEQLVTFPIETAVNGSIGVRRVRSSSTNGFSVVWVEFNWNTDIYLDRQIVSEKLAEVSESLPPTVGRPTLGPQSSILGEMLIVGLTADSTSLLDLRTIADWSIRPRLLSTGGVAQVSVLGGDIKEFQIQLDPGLMKHYGVSVDEVVAATKDMNLNANGGVVYEYGNEYIVRGVLSTNNVERLKKALIRKTNEMPIYLGDVAEIKINGKAPKLGCASLRGHEAVLLTVTKQPNTSTIELTEKLEEALNDIQKNLPRDVKVSTDIFRQSQFIESSIHNVQRSLLEGGIFVVIVLFLFLANVRTTLISLVTLPLSLLVSILVLHYMGMSINTMSLGGMAIAIGSLVDDAIVDVENVFKRLRENKLKPVVEQDSVIKIVFEASKEVRMPILNSTLIIVVSFVPLFFLTGMEGRMLVPLGVSFIVSLFASTIVALTLTPVLCSYLLGREKGDKLPKEAFVALWMQQIYRRSLMWALANKRIVLAGTAVLFIAALVTFLNLGRSFLPSFNEGSFTINVSSLPGISLEESNRLGLQAEQALLSIPEIQTVARKTGRAELDEHALGVNVSEIEAPFILKDRSRNELIADVRKKLSIISGANIEIGQPISHRIDAMLSGTRANIAIKLFGDDLNKMFVMGNRIKQAIAQIEGIADLNVEQQIERPQLTIVPRREILAKYGITLPEFSEYIRIALAGETVSQVYEGGKAFDLTVKVKENSKDEMAKIAALTIDTSDGKKVPLSYVADISSTAGPNTINRENVKRKIVISANVENRDLRSVVNDIQKQIDETITLPEGYHIEYGGQFESEEAASRTLALTSFLSVIVIFLLLYHQFKSSTQAGVILLNLPLALIGGVFMLAVTAGELSIPAIIGFISLFGIATRNGMLLVSHYQHLQEVEGYSLQESIIKGSLDRLNPILMTALSSALALIPLAINGDLAGNEIQSPMAKVILGGLLTSTFLNGFIVPIVYRFTAAKKKSNH